jgi:hypothetical protein
MRWQRFAPEEKNKENQNDTDCLCDGGRGVADVGRLGDVASRADCAYQWGGYRRPKQCDASLLVSSSASPSLLAWLSRPFALPLVVIGRQPAFSSAAPIVLGAAFAFCLTKA